MKHSITLTTALFALFLILVTGAGAAAQSTAGTPTQNTNAPSVPQTKEELDKWQEQQRREADAATKKTMDEIDQQIREGDQRLKEQQRQFERQINADQRRQQESLRNAPPPATDFYNNNSVMDERARYAQELKARQEQEAKEYAVREQNILRYTAIFLLILAPLITFAAFKYPKSGFRTGALMSVIGIAIFVIIFYSNAHNFYSQQYGSAMRTLITFGWLAGAVVGSIGLAKIAINFAAMPKNKTARILAVLVVGSGIIFAGAWFADVSQRGSTLRLVALFALLTGVFSFVGGLIKASRGSSTAPTSEDEEAYHGSARFATEDEIRELTIKRGQVIEPGSFILAPAEPEKGRKGQVVLPRMQTTQHGLILGGTGTGKSRGYFLPNCAQAVDTSLVVTDPKSELWKLTSGFQPRAFRYAPADPDASEGFNWIPLCSDARMAELCARAIMQSGNTSHTDQFFIDTETAFLAALFAHASTLPEATPLTAYRLFTRQAPDDLIKQLLESPSETAREQAVIFMQTDPRYKGAIVPAVAARLQFMRDKAMQRFTSATLDAPDFGRLRREPTAIYWCLREQDIVRLRPLTSLFFTVLLEQLAGEQAEGLSGVPVTMMLDEFANIGTIPDFETTISLARGRGVALWLGVQSLSQLDKAYGHSNAQTIITNCLTKVALHALDYNTARYVSDTLGESTIVAKRHGFSFSPTGLVSVSRHGTEHRKMLMTPDEVMRLSETEAIVRTGNKYPMKLRKGYYDEPANTAPASALGEAITKDFPPLVLADGATAKDTIDIL